jgi:hypothetical protein
MAVCRKLGDLALGILKPWPGQEDMYCGYGSCGAFKEMFLNGLVPVRYSKVAFAATAVVATGITVLAGGANAALIAFANSVGDTAAANTGYATALTLSETNYQTTENPVPQNSDYRFCLVGISMNVELPYHSNAGAQEFGDYITQVAEYRETIRENMLHNGVLTMAKGNNRCAFQLGLFKHFHGSNQVSGGDTRNAGRADAGPLSFTPLNAVVVMESLVGAQRMTLGLQLNRDFVVRPTSVPVTAETLLIPVETEMWGFLVMAPGCGSFYDDLPEEQKPPGLKAAQGAWGG